jgi:hypothetical protein
VFLALSLAIAILIALPLAILGWESSAELRGEYQAYRDVQHGQYKQLGYGLAVAWRSDYAKLIHQRHPDAQFVAVAGCIVSPGLVDYVHGYNKYAHQAAIRHFGHDVFQEAAEDAEQAYSVRHEVNATR